MGVLCEQVTCTTQHEWGQHGDGSVGQRCWHMLRGRDSLHKACTVAALGVPDEGKHRQSRQIGLHVIRSGLSLACMRVSGLAYARLLCGPWPLCAQGHSMGRHSPCSFGVDIGNISPCALTVQVAYKQPQRSAKLRNAVASRLALYTTVSYSIM